MCRLSSRPVSATSVLLLALLVRPVAGWAALRGPSQRKAEVASIAAATGTVPLGVALADEPRNDEIAGTEPWSHWVRGALAVAAALLVVVAGAPTRSASAAGATGIDVYFGQGCFWHVQHSLVGAEIQVLGRGPSDITATSGYAGGSTVGSKGEVCYHNLAFAPTYSDMGHTEVVKVNVPEDKVGDVAKGLIADAAKFTFGRHDPQDLGSEYRSAIGLPGGMDGPYFKQLEEANAAAGGKIKFVRGKGNDGDTVGTKKIWVYDTAEFPFYQGEVWHQFHDDMADRYSDEYHQLKSLLMRDGKLQRLEYCP